MKWVAYCTKCKKDLTEGGWNNGAMVEAQAYMHQEETDNTHKVIVGFFYQRKEKKDEDCGR